MSELITTHACDWIDLLHANEMRELYNWTNLYLFY